ncbi:MAG: hypothetical protein K9J21_06435 [Bacteroidales bacterium]|nr:hypothetical protein [Bacteroidales bacterium]
MPDYIEHNNIFWKKYQGALIPENPPHVDIDLSKKEQQELLEQSGAWFLRWPSDWDTEKSTSWWYVIKDDFQGMEELSKNTRSKVRRALKRQKVDLASAKEIADEGYEVYQQAFRNYDTFLKPMSRKEFSDYVLSLNPDYWEFFACRNAEDGAMTAYSQNLVMDHTAEYKIIKLHPDYLKDYPSYALIYTMNEEYLQKRDMKYVNDGARSISHQTNIQQFLMDKFKFRKAFTTLNLTYRKPLKLVVSSLMPFCSLIGKIKARPFQRLSILLTQEALYRQSQKSKQQ